MAETDFAVVYDGPALVDGRMPVKDLAPALLSLGDLFVDVGSLLHPDRPPVALDIRATQEGSFDVLLILTSPDAWDRVVDLFNSDAVTALVNMKELVIGGGLGLFWFIKWLRGRWVDSEEP